MKSYYLKRNDQMLFLNMTMLLHKLKKKWLENKSIRLMFWPGQSPDLDPIVNILAYIKLKQTQTNKIFQLHELFKAINIDLSSCELSASWGRLFHAKLLYLQCFCNSCKFPDQ